MPYFEKLEKWLAIGAGAFCIVASLVLEMASLLPLPPEQIGRMEESRDRLWDRGIMLGLGTGATGAAASAISAIAKRGRRNISTGDEVSFVPDFPPDPQSHEWLDSLEERLPPDENIQILMSQGYSYQEAEQIMRQSERRSPGE